MNPNMEILIGREKESANPRLMMTDGIKELFIGKPGSVPKTVSREHCRLVLRENGTIESIANISGNNLLYINGKECRIYYDPRINDVIELGPERVRVDLSAVVKSFVGTPTFHISHLKKVYEDYQEAILDMQIKQGKLGTIASVPIMISMFSGILATIIPGLPLLKIALMVVALSLMVFILIRRSKTSSENPIRRRELDNKYHDEYVCPNPNCRHYFSSTRYEDLLNNTCPKCKSRLIE